MPLWIPNPTIEPLITPVKRGQSRVTTLTESSYPTDKPNSNYNHGQPTIGGSVGGFIGLVVGLGVLAIITSVAAFILIRRRRRTKGGSGGGDFAGFPKAGGISGLFGRKKSKGWMQTHSYTDHNDEHDDIQLKGAAAPHSTTTPYNQPHDAPAGRVYDDPFNAESLDNLQTETSARIDHGPEYQPVAGADTDLVPSHSPTTLAGGTKFREGL